MNDRLTLPIPPWLNEYALPKTDYSLMEHRVELALNLAKVNIAKGTGGPFGAVIFSVDDWRPLTMGVSLVTHTNCSLAHAEIVAIMRAEQMLGCYDLSQIKYELVTSSEPCAMCFGAILWSGVCSMVYGSTSSDVEAIGFDEGEKPEHWQEALKSRGIATKGPVLQQEAKAVLLEYQEKKGEIYNSGFNKFNALNG